jgi:tetrahydromethanopterin S-methyltransferase subunit B
MRDDFDDIRAERDRPIRSNSGGASQYAGLWKQIALGIVVGYVVLGVLSVIGWAVTSHLLLSGLKLGTP